MKIKKFFLNVLELFSVIIFVTSIILFYLNQTGSAIFFNADNLLINELFNNIFHENGLIKNWIIPSTFCFFPDWIVYFSAFLTSHKPYIQFLIVACEHTLLLYWLVRLIYRQFFLKKIAVFYSLASVGVFIYLAIQLVSPYTLLLTVCYHAGAFLIGILYIYSN